MVWALETAVNGGRIVWRCDWCLCLLQCQAGLFQMTLLLRMDDQMNRQLTCEFSGEDTPKSLAEELVGFGFINEVNGSGLCVEASNSLYMLLLPPGDAFVILFLNIKYNNQLI